MNARAPTPTPMPSATDRAAEWIYSGIWGFLVPWFRVPAEPPSLPHSNTEPAHAFKPARAFLRYQKLFFWIALIAIDVALTIAWIAVLIASPILGGILFLPYLLLAIVPDILAYIAIHLRYDSTWYVLGPRSLRIRRGLWIIRETTVTFENIQNVDIQQGPIQRHFGIASLIVHTAGGGTTDSTKNAQHMGAHIAVIEGITNATQIRDQIMQAAAASRSAGLGDDPRHAAHPAQSPPMWTPAHLEALREVRNLAASAAQLARR